MIRVLVTGAQGQVGAEVARVLSPRAEVASRDRAALDLADPDAIRHAVRDVRPALIVNAGAYTAVDRAESEPDVANAVNGVAPGVLAEEAKRLGALLVHYSTDYVFDGTQAAPYAETDPVAPASAYGRSKLAGEAAVEAVGCAHLTLRTSWVYGPRGRNFMLTMLRAGAERPELRVVADQHGAPTSSLQLADLLARLLAPGDATRAIGPADIGRLAAAPGLYHATAAGSTTWHGFAEAILEGWRRRVPSYPRPRVAAITTAEWPTPARRPANSVLSNAKLERAFGTRIGDWRAGLDEVLSALPR